MTMILGSDAGQIDVRSYLGIESATIPLPTLETGPVIVRGRNASGKSSFCTALAAILGQTPNPLGLAKNRNKRYVHEGRADGTVSLWNGKQEVARLTVSDRSVRLYPGHPDPVAIETLGLVRFVGNLKPAERLSTWENIFLPDVGGVIEKVDKKLSQVLADRHTIDEVLDTLRISGWINAEKHYGEIATQSGRDWAAITGETYGVNKGPKWRPTHWHQSLEGLGAVEAEAQVSEAEEHLKHCRETKAVSEAEAARAKVASEKLPAAEAELGSAEQAYQMQLNKVDGIVVDERKLTVAGMNARKAYDAHRQEWPKGEHGTPCPACGIRLSIMEDRTLCRSEDPAVQSRRVSEWEEKLRVLAAALNDLREKVRTIRSNLKEERLVLARLEGRRNACADNVRILKRDIHRGDGDVVDDGELALRVKRAEARFDTASKRAKAVGKHIAAQEHGSSIQCYRAVKAVLGPKGVRATMIRDRLHELEKILHQFDTLTGWGQVELDATYAVYLNNRPIALCSESEQWRAQVMLMSALAVLDSHPIVVMDRAELLGPANVQWLVKLVEMLRAHKVCVVICATYGMDHVAFPPPWTSVMLHKAA